jgi:hypothetical protein
MNRGVSPELAMDYYKAYGSMKLIPFVSAGAYGRLPHPGMQEKN